MPDMTVEVHYRCLSSETFTAQVEGSGGRTHTVRHCRTPGGPCQTDWTCDCKGFRFRRECGHIEKAKADGGYCGWLQFTDGGEPGRDAEGNPTCPKCGGRAVAEQWAV